jgi:hypothetical protein
MAMAAIAAEVSTSVRAASMLIQATATDPAGIAAAGTAAAVRDMAVNGAIAVACAAIAAIDSSLAHMTT